MEIEFKNVIPTPLKDQFFGENSNWGKPIHLSSGNNYFVSSPSGKGKSTFLNIIFGIRNDFEGNVYLNKKDCSQITSNEWAEIRKNKLSILPQDTKLFAELTVKENLLLKNGLTDYKSESEIIELTQQFHLEDKLNVPCGVLSFGQQQRIGIIRSLLQPFEFLLLDEPFSNIDDQNIEISKKMILNAANETNGNLIIASLGYKYGLGFKTIEL